MLINEFDSFLNFTISFPQTIDGHWGVGLESVCTDAIKIPCTLQKSQKLGDNDVGVMTKFSTI